MTSDNKSIAFFKGKYVPLEEANISIMNHSFMYGTAIFEGIRGYWNAQEKQVYIFRLREHFERMMDSMRIMYHEIDYTVDQLCDIVIELVRRNLPTMDIYVRPAVYKTALRIGPSLEDNPSDICILTVPLGDYFHGVEGLKVCISSWRRVEDNAIPARAKITGAYANTALAKTDAMKAGFDDCIVLSENGHVSEGSAMNIFLVKRGHLVTTPISENILEGVTRRSILELCEEEFHLPVTTRSIDRSELYTADELFFCGTGAQVTPIVEVDRRTIGDGNPGKISLQIKEKYQAICHGKEPKYRKWITPVYSESKKSAENDKLKSVS